jgi:hypothetical protein
MVEPRKVVIVEETLHRELGSPAPRPVTKVAALALIANPFAGKGHIEDLSALVDVGARLGEKLMPRLVAALQGRPATSYGKAAIVGVAGEVEHGAAVLHPRLGKPMRAALGGGEAIISSAVKVAAAGTPIDVPLAHKDTIWSFDHLDAMTVAVFDAPRPDEIVVAMVIADGGRLAPRVGSGPIR